MDAITSSMTLSASCSSVKSHSCAFSRHLVMKLSNVSSAFCLYLISSILWTLKLTFIFNLSSNSFHNSSGSAFFAYSYLNFCSYFGFVGYPIVSEAKFHLLPEKLEFICCVFRRPVQFGVFGCHVVVTITITLLILTLNKHIKC